MAPEDAARSSLQAVADAIDAVTGRTPGRSVAVLRAAPDGFNSRGNLRHPDGRPWYAWVEAKAYEFSDDKNPPWHAGIRPLDCESSIGGNLIPPPSYAHWCATPEEAASGAIGRIVAAYREGVAASRGEIKAILDKNKERRAVLGAVARLTVGTASATEETAAEADADAPDWVDLRDHAAPVWVEDVPSRVRCDGFGEGYFKSPRSLVEAYLSADEDLPGDDEVVACGESTPTAPIARDFVACEFENQEMDSDAVTAVGRGALATLQDFLGAWFDSCGVTVWRRKDARVRLGGDLREFYRQQRALRAADPDRPIDRAALDALFRAKS